MIYSTPMFTWNPFGINFWKRGTQAKDPKRVGGQTPETAYNDSSYANFYHTPAGLFSGKEVATDPSDTTKSNVGVLDKHGNVQRVAASGTRIVLPNIPGVGKIRMRYPIVPVHMEGSGVWKELDALKDMLMDIQKYKGLFHHHPTLTDSSNGTQSSEKTLHLRTGAATRTPPGPHVHDIFLSPDVQESMKHGERKTMVTSEALGHTHQLILSYKNTYSILWCDGQTHCWDGHPMNLYPA
ncbi:uncharacterized protein LOC124152867 [Haliotis rufescens]|uniref:uncharacterized protein LOC124152867 n=1 Tax=Haliotis rufescens TaxID=6454 RepID=UPI00201F3617|nr:uncharacterized protein LOC124152867 [Haliotis rufescens]